MWGIKMKHLIWTFKQNKPSLIVDDLKQKYPNIDEDFIYGVLMKRGVFKWLNVRRNLIKLKDEMKKEITNNLKLQTEKKCFIRKGYLKALVFYREKIRELCHSDRWAKIDIDKRANNWVEKNGK